MMDKVIEDLEFQLQIAFLTNSSQIQIEKEKGLFILERLREMRDKWYEGGENNDI